jgi:hypothetical protein
MNRHILGLSVFLVIVKTTFLIYWGFFAPKPFVSFVENEVYTRSTPNNKTNCFPKLEKPLAAPVDSVILDSKTGKFNISLDLSRKYDLDSSENAQIFLAVYTKDPKPRLISTIFISPEYISVNQIQLTCYVSWVTSLKANQNLYVVPYNSTGKIIPNNFDEAHAIPVLLIGKR